MMEKGTVNNHSITVSGFTGHLSINKQIGIYAPYLWYYQEDKTTIFCFRGTRIPLDNYDLLICAIGSKLPIISHIIGDKLINPIL